jgi:hypothetical protein
MGDVPLEVRAVADQFGWEHFGRISFPDTSDPVLIAGPNKASRIKAARVAEEKFMKTHLHEDALAEFHEDTEHADMNCVTSHLQKHLHVSLRNGDLNILADNQIYCKGGVDAGLLLARVDEVCYVGPTCYRRCFPICVCVWLFSFLLLHLVMCLCYIFVVFLLWGLLHASSGGARY